jgi:hypothetical protein
MVDWAENELSVIGLNVSVAIEKGDRSECSFITRKSGMLMHFCQGGAGLAALWNGSGSVASRLDWFTKAHCSVEVVRNPIS